MCVCVYRQMVVYSHDERKAVHLTGNGIFIAWSHFYIYHIYLLNDIEEAQIYRSFYIIFKNDFSVNFMMRKSWNYRWIILNAPKGWFCCCCCCLLLGRRIGWFKVLIYIYAFIPLNKCYTSNIGRSPSISGTDSAKYPGKCG